MKELQKNEERALEGMLARFSPEQCFEVMKKALNAFIQKACDGQPGPVRAQYGRLVQPVLHHMVALDVFHTVFTKGKEGERDDE